MEIAGGPSRPVHEGLECWVALNSEQVDALFAEGAKPDEYSQRFGLRRTPVEALGRAAEFMAWRPRGQSEEPNPKSLVLCRVFVPASGYMIMTEQGRLETKKEGEWRLYGELKTRETLMVGETEVVLYEIHPELFEVI